MQMILNGAAGLSRGRPTLVRRSLYPEPRRAAAISKGGGIPPTAAETAGARCGAEPHAPRPDYRGSPGNRGSATQAGPQQPARRLPRGSAAPLRARSPAGWLPRSRSLVAAHASVSRTRDPPARIPLFLPAASSGSRYTPAVPWIWLSHWQSPESGDLAARWYRASRGPSESGPPDRWLRSPQARGVRGLAKGRASGSERGSR